MSTRKALGGWKRRYLVLQGAALTVYRDASLTVLKAEHSLRGALVTTLEDGATG